ncbi:ABC transporter permease [Francisellaceae bacterium]|nr:ABC transporter permease [Francisellaceae bacterium]
MLGLKSFYLFFKEIFEQRKTVWALAKNDFKQQYLGSALGMSWAFIQPTIMIALYWFVFTFGFKSPPLEKVPFICWLVAGLIPYFFFSDAWSKATNVVTEYDYLVKKIVFPVRVLPLLKLISASYIHLFFIAFVIVLFAAYGFYPNLYYLQIFYYLFALWVLLLGLSWFTCAVQVFLKDMSQLVVVSVQILFWGTPILYPVTLLKAHPAILTLLKLNPLFYIVEGYRDIFVNHVWFWEHPGLTLYFWVFSFCMLLFGMLVFQRLRPHFADVL